MKVGPFQWARVQRSENNEVRRGSGLGFRQQKSNKALVYGAQDSAPQEWAVRVPFTWIWFSPPVPKGNLSSEQLTETEIQSNGLEEHRRMSRAWASGHMRSQGSSQAHKTQA